MRIIIDRQHAGKPGSNDRGASYDIDGNGVVALGERETDVTLLYGEELMREARARSIPVTTLGWPGYVGSYAERHATACRIARETRGTTYYIALHANAGGGRYALALHDARSVRGRHIAASIARCLGELDEVSEGQVRALGPRDRGYSCISGVYTGPRELCGVLVEPGFLDQPLHAPLWRDDGPTRIARAIIRALA